MAVIRWQLVAPIANSSGFKGDLLSAPYRSGTVRVRSASAGVDEQAVTSPVISVTPAQDQPTHVLLVVDLYAGGAFLIVTDQHPTLLPSEARSVAEAGDDEWPSTLLLSESDAPDVPVREVRALRIGQHFFFQSADR